MLRIIASLVRPSVLRYPPSAPAPADPARGPQPDPARVTPGDGILDLAAEIQWLRDVGYATSGGRTISLELFNPGLWEKDPNEVLALGMERMKGLL